VKIRILLVLLLGLFLIGSEAFADANSDSDLISRVMRLRLEVEEKNAVWEQEKKRLQTEYEAILQRTSEIQADILRKRSQLEVLRAREIAAKKRTERRQTTLGADREKLTLAVSEIIKALDATIPIGRKEYQAKLVRLSKDIEEGRGSVDEFSSDLAQAVKSELKMSRGLHLLKEELDVESELVPVEAVRIGGYASFFAAADGRVGEWNRTKRRAQWVTDPERRRQLLTNLEVVRKSAMGSRPVLLDFDLEAK
jgi:hypothetical protein